MTCRGEYEDRSGTQRRPWKHLLCRLLLSGLPLPQWSEAETRKRRAFLLPSSSLSFPPSHPLQPASPLCSDHRARPLALRAISVCHALAPCPPGSPKAVSSRLNSLPRPLPNMCGAHGLLPRPGAASRGQETEISPLGRFSSAQRAWGLCRAPLSSPHASSR